ncbi:uncharacterized protein BJ171DRAFT_518990 [Polychytrium aggregatum]|uniref:uncharacterized protein n=1 Tax=Polychytrium aggregatum TaxID=110093 RepID=UPI0022FEDF7B|nr:uncharacterized protein BJ171DRAFT_518990 [Polychytrium aggregatum]KAI9199382.1 hypothetical protein BJ171DRAFT_518990 [Polychytrium aggregatum]
MVRIISCRRAICHSARLVTIYLIWRCCLGLGCLSKGCSVESVSSPFLSQASNGQIFLSLFPLHHFISISERQDD